MVFTVILIGLVDVPMIIFLLLLIPDKVVVIVISGHRNVAPVLDYDKVLPW